MAIKPQPYIRSNLAETSMITVNCDENAIHTITLDPIDNPWFNRNTQKMIDLNKIDDCYFLVYKAIINNVSAEKAKEYEALLKMNQEDYKITVLQIETGEENAN